MFLKNTWYAAGFASEVRERELLARTIAGTPLVFYRGADGKMAALLDRCPHRMAPLSRGKLIDGNVQCGYHGITFDSAGTCVANPFGPIAQGLKVASYRVEERHGVAWLWLGNRDAADPDAIPDLWFIDAQPATSRFKGYIPVKAHHQLLVDNILDLSHSDYLHPSTLANVTPEHPKVSEIGDSTLTQWMAERTPAMPIHYPYLPSPDTLVDNWSDVHWHPSGAMHMKNGSTLPGKAREEGLVAHAAHMFTPETADTTHYFYAIWRNWEQENEEYNEFFGNVMRTAFTEEDTPMIEAQQARIGLQRFDDMNPVIMPMDRAPSRARRMYDRLLAAEQGDGA